MRLGREERVVPSTRKVKFLHSTYGLLVRIRTYEVYIRGHGHAGCYVDGVGGHGMMSIFAGGIRKKNDRNRKN